MGPKDLDKATIVWNIAEFLPKSVRRFFFIFTLEYIKELYNSRPKTQDKNADAMIENGDEQVTGNDVPDPMTGGDAPADASVDRRGTSTYTLATEWEYHRDRDLKPHNKQMMENLEKYLHNVVTDLKDVAVSGDGTLS